MSEEKDRAMVVAQPQAVTPIMLIDRALTAGVDIEKMSKLFDLQLRWEKNEAMKEFHRAVAAFKLESVEILKDKKVGYTTREGDFVGYSHATLGNIVQTIIPAMSKHGLSHSWKVDQSGANVSVTCVLTHELGHSCEVTMTAGKDDSGKKNQIQQVASAVTYLQRYTLLAITGLAASDQDDDGESAGIKTEGGGSKTKPAVEQPRPAAKGNDKPATENQVKMIRTKLSQAKISPDDFCHHFKISEVEELPMSSVNDALKAIANGSIATTAEELCPTCGGPAGFCECGARK